MVQSNLRPTNTVQKTKCVDAITFFEIGDPFSVSSGLIRRLSLSFLSNLLNVLFDLFADSLV